MVTSLCTRDVYLLTDGKQSFLWTGKGASKDEERAAAKIATKVAESQPGYIVSTITPYTAVKERMEPVEFWKLLAPTFDVPHAVSIITS